MTDQFTVFTAVQRASEQPLTCENTPPKIKMNKNPFSDLDRTPSDLRFCRCSECSPSLREGGRLNTPRPPSEPEGRAKPFDPTCGPRLKPAWEAIIRRLLESPETGVYIGTLRRVGLAASDLKYKTVCNLIIQGRRNAWMRIDNKHRVALTDAGAARWGGHAQA